MSDPGAAAASTALPRPSVLVMAFHSHLHTPAMLSYGLVESGPPFVSISDALCRSPVPPPVLPPFPPCRYTLPVPREHSCNAGYSQRHAMPPAAAPGAQQHTTSSSTSGQARPHRTPWSGLLKKT